MGAVHIKLTRDKIVNTNVYKGMSRITQKITTSRNNVLAIDNGVHVASFLGYDKWEIQSNFSWTNKRIVKELCGG